MQKYVLTVHVLSVIICLIVIGFLKKIALRMYVAKTSIFLKPILVDQAKSGIVLQAPL